jgi:hypothetical protein
MRHDDGHKQQIHNHCGGGDSLFVGTVQHLTGETEKLYKMPQYVAGNLWRGNK